MSNHAATRAHLKARLHTLLDRVTRIEGDLRKPHDPDWIEQATQLENDEVLEGLDELSRDEVQQIRLALRRIEEGTYGRCSSCNGLIGGARLAALPTTSTCIMCAQ